MPWPAFMKPWHRVINPVALRLAGRAGSLALLEHRGRNSGRQYRNPVRAYRRGDRVAIGANFGAHSQWVRNVLAADGCALTLRGQRLHLTNARLIPLDEMPAVFPGWFRLGLRYVVRTRDCVLLQVEPQPTQNPRPQPVPKSSGSPPEGRPRPPR